MLSYSCGSLFALDFAFSSYCRASSTAGWDISFTSSFFLYFLSDVDYRLGYLKCLLVSHFVTKSFKTSHCSDQLSGSLIRQVSFDLSIRLSILLFCTCRHVYSYQNKYLDNWLISSFPAVNNMVSICSSIFIRRLCFALINIFRNFYAI